MHRLFSYKLPLKNGKLREGLILQSENRYGEIAPLPGFSKETLNEARLEVQDWMNTGKTPTLPSVKWGIECVQKTLQSVHLPLCALGPKSGFSTIKLKLGHLPLADAISYVKEYTSRALLRLDCNQAWSLPQALEFARHFKPTDFAYLEEPVQSFDELVEFSKITGFPIALDESIHSDWSQIPSLKAIVVKPTIVGTIPQIPPHLDLVLSSAYESGLGLLHIANQTKNSLPIGLDTYSAFEDDLLTQKISCSNGIFSWNPSNPILEMSKLCAL